MHRSTLLLCFISLLLCSSLVTADDILVDDYLPANGNDNEAITAAIAAANPGDRIIFTAGKTYNIANRTLINKTDLSFVGNGATLRRINSVDSALTSVAAIGATSVQVADASGYSVGMEFSPVKGAGGLNEGEGVRRHTISSIVGNTIHFTTIGGPAGLARDYAAGDATTSTFDMFLVQSSGVSFDDFIFEGNRDNNDTFVSWTRNRNIVLNEGSSVTNSVFKNMPSDALVTSKSDLNIQNNLFKNLNTSAVHLSGLDNELGQEALIKNNVIFNSNNQASRAGHAEGAITISLRADHLRIQENLIVDSDTSIISYFHHDMEDWQVDKNMVENADQLFWGSVRLTGPLDTVAWTNNLGNNVGDSFLVKRDDGEILDWVFDNNTINDGTFRFEGLTGGSISNNTLRAGSNPLTITDSDTTALNGGTADGSFTNQGGSHDLLLIYNTYTGEVTLDGTGLLLGDFDQFIFASDDFDLSGLNTLSGDLLLTSKFGIGFLDANGITTLDLGAILPTGMTNQELQNAFLFASYTDSNGNYGGFSFTAVPEPSAAGMLSMLMLWGAAQRRRR